MKLFNFIGSPHFRMTISQSHFSFVQYASWKVYKCIKHIQHLLLIFFKDQNKIYYYQQQINPTQDVHGEDSLTNITVQQFEALIRRYPHTQMGFSTNYKNCDGKQQI